MPKRWGSGGKSIVVASGQVMAIAILALVGWGASSAHAQTKKVEDRGRYYRITADYTYKGAPLRIDFGLACAARITTYRDNDTSFDVFSSPDLYGVRTSDNAAVVISTYEYCRAFQGHPMPPDFLPITVVYDDPETLAFGIMYASDEAYANPSSVLTLPEVNVARMTRTEYDEIRRTGVRNVVRNPRNDGQLRAKRSEYQPGKKPPIGTSCHGWRRLELPAEARSILREHWPSDKPKFWRPEARSVSLALEEIIQGMKIGGWNFYNYRMTGQAGLPRTEGGGDSTIYLPRHQSSTLLPSPSDEQ
jgi:hypothetical protein